MNNNGLNVTAFFILTWTPEVQLWIPAGMFGWMQIWTGSEDPAHSALLAQGLSSPRVSFLPGWGAGGGNAAGRAAGSAQESQTMNWTCLGNNNLNPGPENSSSPRLLLSFMTALHLHWFFSSSSSLCQSEKNEFLELGSASGLSARRIRIGEFSAGLILSLKTQGKRREFSFQPKVPSLFFFSSLDWCSCAHKILLL